MLEVMEAIRVRLAGVELLVVGSAAVALGVVVVVKVEEVVGSGVGVGIVEDGVDDGTDGGDGDEEGEPVNVDEVVGG